MNPYDEDPAEYFAYLPILANREVVVIPTKKKHERVIKTCEKLFGLSRAELMDLRFQRYSHYMTLKHTLADPGISVNIRQMSQNRINEMVSDKGAYAGMIRYFETKPLASLPWDFSI